MSARPTLNTSGLSAVNEDSTIASPARGKETRNNLLQKLRPPQLVHKWVFWYEKPPVPKHFGGEEKSNELRPTSSESAATDENIIKVTTETDTTVEDPSGETKSPKQAASPYSARLSALSEIADVKAFWSLFNNFSLSSMPSRSSVHLFHSTVQPLWEDVRNARGGAWDVRVHKAQAAECWKILCVLAIGEMLQSAVSNEGERATFRDDICGVSFRPRWNSTLLEVWNRDAGHDKGIMEVKRVVQEAWAEAGLKAVEWRYRKHTEREGFNSEIVEGRGLSEVNAAKADADEQAKALEDAKRKSMAVHAKVAAVEKNVEAMQEKLEAVKMNDEQANQKVALEVGKEEAKLKETGESARSE